MAILSRIKYIALVVLAAVAMSVLAPTASFASEKGRRNTAIGLTAFAAYQLLRGNTTTGIVAGAGAYYAWKRAKDADTRLPWQRSSLPANDLGNYSEVLGPLVR